MSLRFHFGAAKHPMRIEHDYTQRSTELAQ
jgi:hypothetical protein